jgi:hypothetical protein
MPPEELGPIVVVAVPVLVLYVLSRVTGWQRLAERYPSVGMSPEPHTRLGYGVFRGWLGYNGALVVGSDAGGLYVGTWAIFSWCHPAFYIPWSEVSEIRTEGSGWNERLAIRTVGAPEIDFALRPPTFARVRDDAKQAGVPGEY